MTNGDLGTCVTRSSIQSHTVTTRGTVHFNLARVRLEASCGVFGGDTRLNGKATAVDVFLGKTELGKGDTSSNLDLSGNDVDTGDFLCMSALTRAQ